MNLTWDDRQLRRTIRSAITTYPKVAADAMNRTGEECNAAIRETMARNFTIRNKTLTQFVAPLRLKREQQARADQLSVVLNTEGSGKILNPYQYGIPKTGKPDAPVAVPTKELRPTKQTVIPPRWFPQNLGLTPKRDPQGHKYFALGRGAIGKAKTPQHVTRVGKIQIKGKDRTFVLDPSLHDGVTMRQWGVYQRIGPKKEDIRMLWGYERSVPRPHILQFYEVAIRTWNARLAINFRGVFAGSLGRGR